MIDGVPLMIPDVPVEGSRWSNGFHVYTVLFTTNLAHMHRRHPPQVVYKGDNGNVWSMDLKIWPGKLTEIVS